MEENTHAKIYSKEVLDFLAVVTEFTLVIDELPHYSQKELVKYTLKLLPLIYIKAQLLPDIEIEDPDCVEKFVSEEEWNKVKWHVERLFADLDEYKENIGRFESNETNYISENFADIYQDIKDFTSLYNTAVEEFMVDAVAEVKRNFAEYWGQRLVNTLRIFHYYNYNENLSEEKPFCVEENIEEWLTEQRKNEWGID